MLAVGGSDMELSAPVMASHEWLSAASLTLQVGVAAYALWLNRVFGTQRAGWALCAAFVLMLAMHLNEAFSPPVTVSALGLRPEMAYLFISLLLLLGLSHLSTLYRERGLAELAVCQARDDLEKRVQERTAELASEVEQKRASQQMYRGLVDSLEGVIFECHADDLSFTFVSPQSERLLGYSPEECLKSVGWVQMVHANDCRHFMDSWFRAVRDKAGATEEFRVLAKDGRIRWVRLLANVAASPGGRLQVRGVLLDITDRKELEDQLRQAQKMEAVGRLSGGVAHDFNNILTAIQGYGQLLLDLERTTDQAGDYLKQICDAAARGSQMTRQLLAFSRKQELRVEPTDLNKVVEGTSKMARVLLGAQIDLRQDLAEPLPSVEADATQLTQVVMNLAVNARDAMPGGGTLTIKTESITFTEADQEANLEVRAGSYCCLSVSDTGTGIPQEILPHIFEPFYTTKDAGKGTGLGLSTVYGIIKQHGGWITVDTALGRGTTFRLFLPESNKRPQVRTEPQASPREIGNETILLVEDDPGVRQMASSVLKAQGYKVLEADSGPAALRVWDQRRKDVDLLLTDIVMPEGMTGWDVVKRLRQDNPKLKAVAMSGYTPEPPTDLEVVFLPKPYQAHTLVKVVADALGSTLGQSPEAASRN
jgi:two-component system cell cycle sensor histidine kinase/response regulator CckA